MKSHANMTTAVFLVLAACTCRLHAQAPTSPAKTPVSADDSNKEWEARAIVGYHQAGASSAKSTQNFFMDFYVARALSSAPLWGDDKGAGRWSLWGGVRIASTPQQVTSGVGVFVSGFADSFAKLPVNQMAQSADFQTGLEYRIHTWNRKQAGQYRTLGVVGFFGAMGTFDPPEASLEIYDVPAPTSPQYAQFAKDFPSAAASKYVGFIAPDRERFYRQYGMGFRVTTFDKDSPLAPPGTYTFTVGQDEAITGGLFRSVVGRFDVFYPLPTGSSNGSGAYKFIYLFGTANLRFARAKQIDSFVLQNPNIDASGNPVANPIQGYDPNLALVTLRSTRDTYSIGAGVDLINLFQSILGKNQVPAK